MNENTLRSILREFYNRKMISVIILVWVYGLVFIALAVFSGIKFFKADMIKDQIMYAVIFLCCIQFVALIKIFSWQMIHRNSIKREIAKLKNQISELNGIVKNR